MVGGVWQVPFFLIRRHKQFGIQLTAAWGGGGVGERGDAGHKRTGAVRQGPVPRRAKRAGLARLGLVPSTVEERSPGTLARCWKDKTVAGLARLGLSLSRAGLCI